MLSIAGGFIYSASFAQPCTVPPGTWAPSGPIGVSTCGNVGINIPVGAAGPNDFLHVHSFGQAPGATFSQGAWVAGAPPVGLRMGLTGTNIGQIMHMAANPIIFGTNAAEAMRIDATGQLGIGTTTPSTTLDVNGMVTIQNTPAFLAATNLLVQGPGGVVNTLPIASLPGGAPDMDWAIAPGLISSFTPTDQVVIGTAGVNPFPYGPAKLEIGAFDQPVGLDVAATGVGALNVGMAGLSVPTPGSLLSIGSIGRSFSPGPGTAALSIGVLGTTIDPTGFSGWFAGGVGINVNGIVTPSDKRLKENIEPLEDALSIINQLEPKTYNFKKRSEAIPVDLPTGKQYGLIVQEIEQVLPELTTDEVFPPVFDEDGKLVENTTFSYKSMDYMSLIPILIQGMKEQQEIIKANAADKASQAERIEDLENELLELKDALKDFGLLNEAMPVDVEDATERIVLNQNEPNPFREKTTISYIIPEKVAEAQLVIHTQNGEVIKELDLNNGFGRVDVFASNLSTGTYVYSIVADGKVIVTKRMVVMK